MAFSMAGGSPSNPEINITPLIDILLVLIIIFIVIDTWTPKRKGLEAEIPEQQSQTSPVRQPVRTIVVQVLGQADRVPAVKINEEEVSWDTLEGRLRAIYNTRAEKVAFVQAAKEIDFDYVAQVIDMAHEAGVQRIGLITAGPRQEARLR
ncbi:MAG TPA: biopolymer transporter ExbD [Terriglobales bacterium]|nr:biopolymer transporter ExbD [Terriglobales bacterium]